jgi:hypothetical protein
MKRDFAHLAHLSPADISAVQAIAGERLYGKSWERAFERARGGTHSLTTASDPPRRSRCDAESASAASWRVAFDRAAGHVAPTAKPTPAVLSWDCAFQKAGAVRRK